MRKVFWIGFDFQLDIQLSFIMLTLVGLLLASVQCQLVSVLFYCILNSFREFLHFLIRMQQSLRILEKLFGGL